MCHNEIHLTPQQATWLARTSDENIRRWGNKGKLLCPHAPTGDEHETHPVAWTTLRAAVLAARGMQPPLHPAWLWLDADLPVPTELAALGQPYLAPQVWPEPPQVDEEAVRLRGVVADLERRLGRAIADAEAVDIAAMSYRDSWRRSTEAQSPEDLHGMGQGP